MELGIEDEEEKLYKQAEDVADNVLDSLDNQNESTVSKAYSSKNAKYNFTMNVYCEKLNNEELDRIFNYMNKRFGVEY